jgi:hypothetical protein
VYADRIIASGVTRGETLARSIRAGPALSGAECRQQTNDNGEQTGHLPLLSLHPFTDVTV